MHHACTVNWAIPLLLFSALRQRCTSRSAAPARLGRLRRQRTQRLLLYQPSQTPQPTPSRYFSLAPTLRQDQPRMAGEGEWKNGLCGCFGDCSLCVLTYFLPCVTAGQNAEKVDKSCCLYGFLTLLGCIGIYTRAVVRTQIRETKGIQVGYRHSKQ